MAEWVSHLIIADAVLERVPELVRHEFCIGNIVPDCNIPNEDWSDFTPSRQVTHWMQGKRKTLDDAERFLKEYVLNRKEIISSSEELSYLMGYYAHLVADAELQTMFRNEKRVYDMWKRAETHPELQERIAEASVQDWDTFKKLYDTYHERVMDFHTIEYEYLISHPDSGYRTEFYDLEQLPDYIDYMPIKAVAQKYPLMVYEPRTESGLFPFLCVSRDEYSGFLNRSADIITDTLRILFSQNRV